MAVHAGTLYILPGTHLPQADANGIGEALPPPPQGQPSECDCHVATVAAGDAVLLSDAVLHCSGRNLSAAPRRAWMPQLAASPVLRGDTGAPLALAVPLLRPRKRRRGADA